MSAKPCDPCPWTKRGMPDVPEELKEAAREGAWVCCHVNCDSCRGAAGYVAQQRRVARSR